MKKHARKKPDLTPTPMAVTIFDAVLERMRAIQGQETHYQWVYYHMDGAISNATVRKWLDGEIKTVPWLNSLTKVCDKLGITITVTEELTVKQAIKRSDARLRLASAAE